jgi:hypothetical protein
LCSRSHLAGCAALVAAIAGSRAAAAAAAAPTRTVATIATTDVRVAVDARRNAGSGSAPTAAVSVATFLHVGGHWRAAGSHRLPGTYFWNTVTAAHAICRLEVDTYGTAPQFRPHVVVRLLLSPSLGCGRTYDYEVGR